MRPSLSKTFALLLAAALSGCGGHLGDLLGPPPRPQPPIRPPSAATGAGLTGLCAGDNVVRVDYVLPGQGFEAALFLNSTHANLFSSPPVEAVLTGTNRVYTNSTQPTLVVNGTTLWAGYGLRPVGTTSWTPIGAPIQCRPGAPLYVDLNGPSDGSADGSTPALALPLLDEALLVASVLASFEGTKNVWIASGQYSTRPFNAGIPGTGVFAVGSGVHVYGGFAPGATGTTSAFDLTQRALPPASPTATNSTILVGNATPRILDVINGGAMHILDGLSIDGQSTIVKGVDVSESDVEMRTVRIRDCTDNGLQVKLITNFVNRRDITLVASEVSGNGNDGMGIAGVFDILLDRSEFSANGGRGIDPNDLQALAGDTASLRAFGCRFYGNSIDGLGIDLNTIATQPQTPGGRYDVDIEGCTFERNGRDGLFVDMDYDQFPAWYTKVRIRDCTANANRRAGIHIDADDQGEFTIDRVRCTANAGDGLWISSEPDSPLTSADDGRSTHIVVTNSSMLGNLGRGILSNEGDKVVLASHCAFAGNLLGGFESMVTGPRGDNARRISTAVNCVLWRQSFPSAVPPIVPFTNVRATSCWIESADNPFVNAPTAFAQANSNQSGAITLSANSAISAGDALEVGDDGVKLTVTSSSGGSLVVTPAPAVFVAPDAVFAYPTASTASVVEDLRLYANSLALGTGLVIAGGTAVDPGPHGSDNGGEPGVFDPFTPIGLQLRKIEPPITKGVLPTDAIVLSFDADVSAGSVTSQRIYSSAGTPVSLTVLGSQVTVAPLQPWASDDNLYVLPGVQTASGTSLGAPLAIPVLAR